MNALRLMEAIRDPLAKARQHLMVAEADLNGHIARLAANEPVCRQSLRDANSRVTHYRHEIDKVRLATLEAETLNGRRLCTNDPDDMGTALLTALERIEESGRTRPYEPRLTRDECLPRTGTFW
jgi:hypothetical protein